MSRSNDSETERVAIDKVQEGRRLLHAGEYQEAIAACTEAINLAPDFLGPYQTRAAAYGHLGMEKEAEAQRQHLSDLRGRTQDESSSVQGFSRKGRLGLLFTGIVWSGSAAAYLGLLFGLILFGVLDEEYEHGPLRWMPPIFAYVITGVWALWSVVMVINDLYGVFVATTRRTGTITRMLSTPGSPVGEVEQCIDVGGVEFRVPGAIYANLSQVDRVTVIYCVGLSGSDKVLTVVHHSEDVGGADDVEDSPPDQFTPSWAMFSRPMWVLVWLWAFGWPAYLLYGRG